jgi:hypothetical protein
VVSGRAKVGEYRLGEYSGLWFPMDGDRIVSTLIDMGDGIWRARTPEGGAETVEVPGNVEDPARYVAEEIT